MTAAELLRRCAALGVALTVEAGRLRVAGPAETVRELAPLLRQHRDALLALLAEGTSAAEVPAQGTPVPGAASDRTCTACTHRTRAGSCGLPVEAGLRPHFGIVWPPTEHAARCPAFERRQQAVPGAGTQHPYAGARMRWWPADEAELAAMERRYRRAVALGLTPDEADYVADVQHWGRRVGDDRRLCLECRHLRVGTSSRWHCAAQRQPLPLQFVTGPHRCPTFREASDD